MSTAAIAELQQLEPLIQAHLNGSKDPTANAFLTAFRSRADVLSLCRTYLTVTTSDIVRFFCANTIDHAILNRWDRIPQQERIETMNCLFQILSSNQNMVSYARNALVRSIVLIGRLEWPQSSPDFFDRIFVLCQAPPTLPLGLQLLQTVSQEMAISADDLMSNQRALLKQNLIAMLPQIFGFLESLLTQALQANTVPDLVLSALHCLHSYLQWLPLNSAHQGFNSSIAEIVWRQLPSLFRVISYQNNLTPQAFSCLLEIVERNYAPPNIADYVALIFSEINRLMSLWISSREVSKELNEEYFDNFTFFIGCFVKNQLKRALENPNFHLPQFLTLFSEYATQLTSHQTFLECLQCWHFLLETLSEMRSESKISNLSQFKDPCLHLMRNCLYRIQFRLNDKLEELDNESLLENGVTEMRHFVQSNIDTILLVSKLYDIDSLEQLGQAFFQTADAFVSICQAPTSATSGTQLNHLSQDFITLLQLIGGISELFVTNFDAFLPASLSIWDKMVSVCSAAFPLLATSNAEEIHRVFAQILRTLQSFVPWILHFYTKTIEIQSSGNSEYATRLDYIINGATDLTVACLHSQIPADVVQASLHLLLSISVNVRPHQLLVNHKIQSLAQNLVTVAQSLCGKNQRLLFTIMANISFGKPRAQQEELKQVNDQMREIFRNILSSNILQFSAFSLPENSVTLLQPQASHSFESCLHILSAVFDAIDKQPKATKTYIFESVAPMLRPNLYFLGFLPTNLGLYSTYLDMMQKFLSALSGLLDGSYFAETINALMSVFANESVVHLLTNNGAIALEIVNKYIDILSSVVQNPSAAFAPVVVHIADVISLSFLPLVNQLPNAIEERIKVLDLLRKAIITHWKTISTRATLESAVMCFGQALFAPEPNVFKHVLSLFESIQKNHNLYSREPFVSKFRDQLACQLLMDLVGKVHNTAVDEILATLYDIARVDFGWFFQSCLVGFLQRCESLTDEQRGVLFHSVHLQTDAPSFNATVTGFAWDCARMMRSNNAS